MATPVSDDVRKALAAKDPYALAAAANKEQLDSLRSAEELIEADRKRLQSSSSSPSPRRSSWAGSPSSDSA
jgi:hypothetical protein